MQISLFYFADTEQSDANYRLLLEGTRFADARGLHAVWTPERHFGSFGGIYSSPSVIGAALAMITSRVRIRAGSVVLPLHNPVRVAEEWAIVDNLSGGRVDVSFASGWHRRDFVLAPDGMYDERHAALFRDLETVRRLWRGDTVEIMMDGNPVPIQTRPRPVQPELPVWITSRGSIQTVRAAARSGANLLTHLLGQSLDELASKIAEYREHWRATFGVQSRGQVTLMLHTYLHHDEEQAREIVRGPFLQYLLSSLELATAHANAMGWDWELDPTSMSADDITAVLGRSFDRYFDTSGLLGTPDKAWQMLLKLEAIGVDEVACLIDFGVDHENAMRSLDVLAEISAACRKA